MRASATTGVALIAAAAASVATVGFLSTTQTAPRPSTAVTRLVVAQPMAMSGYARSQYGPRWKDVDRNGCDTRNDILARDLTGERKDGRCVVVSGTLHDPYTGRTIAFTKADANAVQIDHIVPLAESWRSGAAYWTEAKRTEFANDPLNLLAVDGPANMSKGDRAPAQWLPANKAAACRYTTRYVQVKVKYALTVTEPEKTALAHTMHECRTPTAR